MPKKAPPHAAPQVYRTIFISKDVGKHFNMSKKKVQWGLFFDGGSLVSGKKEIFLDKKTIFQDSSLLSFSFEQHLIVGRYPALLEGHYEDKNVIHRMILLIIQLELTINGQLYGLLPYLNRAQVKKMTTGIPVPAESLYDLGPAESLSMYDSSASLIDRSKVQKVLEEESDSEDESRMTPKPIRRTSAAGVKKVTKPAAKKTVKKHTDDDEDVPSDEDNEEEEDEEEEEEEEEEVKPKKKPVAKKPVAKKGVKKVPANDMEADEMEAQRRRKLELEKQKKQDAFGFTESSNGFGIEIPPAPEAPKEEEVDELFEDIPSDISQAKKQKEKEAKGELAFIDDLF